MTKSKQRPVLRPVRKEITSTEYNKILGKIIAKQLPIDQTFIEMIEVAAKYKVKGLIE